MKTAKVAGSRARTKTKYQSLPLEQHMLAAPPPTSGAGPATQLDLDYIYGSTVHCLWASVNGKSYFKWLNDDQIKTIVPPAFRASQVYVQYNPQTLEIQRIRPIRKF